MGSFAWIIMLLPVAGCGASFVAETPRRAAHVCMTFLGMSLLVALFVLGYRLVHETTSITPDISTLSYLSLTPGPSETTNFPATFQVAVGVRVDNLSASFMVLISFLFLVVQGLGTAMLQHDAAYRRFFWASSLLATLMLGLVLSPGLFQVWLTLGAISATTLVLALHFWHRRETTAPARRASSAPTPASCSVWRTSSTSWVRTSGSGLSRPAEHSTSLTSASWIPPGRPPRRARSPMSGTAAWSS
jgi:NADH-quinone oxidoreductase subunit L